MFIFVQKNNCVQNFNIYPDFRIETTMCNNSPSVGMKTPLNEQIFRIPKLEPEIAVFRITKFRQLKKETKSLNYRQLSKVVLIETRDNKRET